MASIPPIWVCPRCQGKDYFWSKRPRVLNGPGVGITEDDYFTKVNIAPSVLESFPVCRTCNEIMSDANTGLRNKERARILNRGIQVFCAITGLVAVLGILVVIGYIFFSESSWDTELYELLGLFCVLLIFSMIGYRNHQEKQASTQKQVMLHDETKVDKKQDEFRVTKNDEFESRLKRALRKNRD